MECDQSTIKSADPEHWIWTWSGYGFGYRKCDSLFTYQGREVGRINQHNEVYGQDGSYIGEIINDRLLVDESKTGSQTAAPFVPVQESPPLQALPSPVDPHPDMPGFHSFPTPEQFTGIAQRSSK